MWLVFDEGVSCHIFMDKVSWHGCKWVFVLGRSGDDGVDLWYDVAVIETTSPIPTISRPTITATHTVDLAVVLCWFQVGAGVED